MTNASAAGAAEGYPQNDVPLPRPWAGREYGTRWACQEAPAAFRFGGGDEPEGEPVR